MSGHAFVVAGPSSGCGKTTLSLALMCALRRRGLRVQPFKVGPDFIDPGFHTQVTGHLSRNLDGWMLTREYNCSQFRRLAKTADAAVVEGVMGLFDGYDGPTEAGSTAQMAKWLGLPVVLVVDARSMARSAAALVLGFSRFDPELTLAGVVFNRVGSSVHLDYLRQAMAAGLPDTAVLGGLPREDWVAIPERHLGLVTSDEISLDRTRQESLAGLVERHLDLDLLLEKTRWTKPEDAPGNGSEPGPEADPADTAGDPLIVAVARDAAFCFYYPDNLELLERAGATLRFFSPLAGETLPREAAGLYLGGGYPELYAGALSEHRLFLDDLRRAARLGMPVYAECGGMMVLSRAIDTLDGSRHIMAGVLPFGTRMLPRRKALGYTEVEVLRPCPLGDAGLVMRGHEFHYSEIVREDTAPEPACAYRIAARRGREPRREGYLVGDVLASYVHLHWGSAPEAAGNWLARCRSYRAGRTGTREQTAV